MISVQCTRNDFSVSIEAAISINATLSISEKSLTIEPVQSSVSETVNEAIAIEGVFGTQPRLSND